MDEMVHGFRCIASLSWDEYNFNWDWIECLLAHSERDGAIV